MRSTKVKPTPKSLVEKISVRELEWGDIEPLWRFVNRLSKEDTYVMLSGEEVTLNEEVEYVARSLASTAKGQKIHLVATRKNEIVGNAEINILEKRKKHVGVITIAIDKSVRSQGLGTTMMRRLIEMAKKTNLKLLTLTSMDVNMAGKSVYENCGFIRIGVVPNALWFRGEYVGESVYYLPLYRLS